MGRKCEIEGQQWVSRTVHSAATAQPAGLATVVHPPYSLAAVQGILA
jgi:hypothetical protein